MMNLRPYQLECLEAIESKHQAGVNRQLVSLPTGSGKTVVFAELLQRMPHKKVLILANTQEQIAQAIEKIRSKTTVSVGKPTKKFTPQIIVTSVQFAWKNTPLLKELGIDLLIVDEAHHFASKSSRKVLFELGFNGKDPSKLLIGFTATPFRTDDLGLGEVFDEIVYQKTIKQVIDLGYLCSPSGYKMETNLDLSAVSIDSTGDFRPISLSRVVDNDKITRLIVESYKEKGCNRQALCFGTTMAHAKNLSLAFNEQGIAAEFVSGRTPQKERTTLVEKFKAGEIKVLCNCQVLTEGFDAPQTSCIIIARPTRSPILYQQIIGRGLRTFEGKQDCLIIEFTDSSNSLYGCSELLRDSEKTVSLKDQTIHSRKPITLTIEEELEKWLVPIDFFNNPSYWIHFPKKTQKGGSHYCLKTHDHSPNFWLWMTSSSVTDFMWEVLIISDSTPSLARKVTSNCFFDEAKAQCETIISSAVDLFEPPSDYELYRFKQRAPDILPFIPDKVRDCRHLENVIIPSKDIRLVDHNLKFNAQKAIDYMRWHIAETTKFKRSSTGLFSTQTLQLAKEIAHA